MSRIIFVTDESQWTNHGSVVTVTGTTEDGKAVRFGGDHRPMGGLFDAVQEQGEVACEVEEWQIFPGPVSL